MCVALYLTFDCVRLVSQDVERENTPKLRIDSGRGFVFCHKV